MYPPLPHAPRRWRARLAAAASALLLAACGGYDEPAPATTPPTGAPQAATAQLSGTAATGAAIANATVTAVNAGGQTATATTNAAGAFTLSIGEGAPYVLKVSDGSGKVWYSYAQAAGTAHLTPLTTLALAQAWGGKPLADLYNGWATTRLTASQVLEAARVVNAHFAAQMQARGVDPATVNVFTAAFSANGQGLDGVLDAIRVSFNCSGAACSPLIGTPSGGALFAWNGSISVAGINLSWATTSSGAGSGGGSGGGGGGSVAGACASTTGAPGSWSIRVQTTVSGLGAIPIPEVCVDGLPAKPANQNEFCASPQAVNQLPAGVSVLSCTWDGTKGTIAARITTPITIDYTITYTFFQR